MRFKLSQADKDYLHSISRNKGIDLGAELLQPNIRGEIFDCIMQSSNGMKWVSPKQRCQ